MEARGALRVPWPWPASPWSSPGGPQTLLARRPSTMAEARRLGQEGARWPVEASRARCFSRLLLLPWRQWEAALWLCGGGWLSWQGLSWERCSSRYHVHVYVCLSLLLLSPRELITASVSVTANNLDIRGDSLMQVSLNRQDWHDVLNTETGKTYSFYANLHIIGISLSFGG